MFNRKTRTVVVFDTNAYREAVGNTPAHRVGSRVQELLREEALYGIRALASPIVLSELLARLADPQHEDYERTKAALVAAHIHCGGSSENLIRILVSSERQMCLTLFGLDPKDLARSHFIVQQLASRVGEDPSDMTLCVLRQDLERIVMQKSKRDLQTTYLNSSSRISSQVPSLGERFCCIPPWQVRCGRS